MSLSDSTPQRVALYARVSTEDQADRGTIQAQTTLLRSLAQAYGWEVVGEYIDDGISGTIPLDQRPEGRRLLADARAGGIMTLVAYRLDRVGRSLRALLDAHDALEGCGVTIRSATEPFDTSTPIGKFLFQLLASLAELEKSTISERMNMGRDRVAREGKWTGGWIPYGYELDASRQLVPSSHMVAQVGMTEAEVARELYRRIADGSSLIEEARRHNALGIPSTRRHGSEPGKEQANSAWSLTRVARIIHSPRYRGTGVLESRFGRIETEVPALVSAELWEAAQAQLLRNRSLSTKNARHRYLLRGLVSCGNCGLGMTGHSMGASARAEGSISTTGAARSWRRPSPIPAVAVTPSSSGARGSRTRCGPTAERSSSTRVMPWLKRSNSCAPASVRWPAWKMSVVDSSTSSRARKPSASGS